MNDALSNNSTNETSMLRGVQRMTICELEELNSKIQTFLDSQKMEVIKRSEAGKANSKSRDIFKSIGVKKLTSNELEKLRQKIQKTLISHDMKFIKHGGVESVSIKYL